jgi:hypothetical protein
LVVATASLAGIARLVVIKDSILVDLLETARGSSATSSR